MENFPLEERDSESFSSNPLLDDPVSLPPKLAAAAQMFHIEHLKSQYEHLLVLQNYHVHQMNTAKDTQLLESYREIVNSIKSVIRQFEALLAKLQSK